MLQIPVIVQAKTRDGKDLRENTQNSSGQRARRIAQG